MLQLDAVVKMYKRGVGSKIAGLFGGNLLALADAKGIDKRQLFNGRHRRLGFCHGKVMVGSWAETTHVDVHHVTIRTTLRTAALPLALGSSLSFRIRSRAILRITVAMAWYARRFSHMQPALARFLN